MQPPFDWVTGKPTNPYAEAHERAALIRDAFVILLLVALAFVLSASIAIIPTMPALGGCLFFGPIMGTAAFIATFGAAA